MHLPAATLATAFLSAALAPALGSEGRGGARRVFVSHSVSGGVATLRVTGCFTTIRNFRALVELSCLFVSSLSTFAAALAKMSASMCVFNRDWGDFSARNGFDKSQYSYQDD